jgi:hypothetical protein
MRELNATERSVSATVTGEVSSMIATSSVIFELSAVLRQLAMRCHANAANGCQEGGRFHPY